MCEENGASYNLVVRISNFKGFTQRDIVLLFVLHFVLNEPKGIECPIGHSNLPESWIVMVPRKPLLNEVIEDLKQRSGAAESERTPKCSSIPSILQNRIETDWWLDFHLFLCEGRHELFAKNIVVIDADQIDSLIC